MKKIIATITLITFFACYPAFAFVPVAIPSSYYLASAVIHAAALAAGVYIKMTESGSTNVSNAGKLKRPSQAVWVDLKDFKPNLNEKNVSTEMTFQQVKSLAAKKNPDGSLKYPGIAAKLKQPEELIEAKDLKQMPAPGTYIKLGDKKYTVLPGGSASYAQQCVPLSSTPYKSGNYITGKFLGGTLTNCGSTAQPASGSFSILVDAGVPIPEVEASPQNFAKNLTGYVPMDGSPLTVNMALQAELDKMFQDPDYVPTFSDDTTGLPFTTPPGVLSPSQLVAANANAVAQEAKAAASSSSSSAVSASSGAASAARDAYQSSGGDPATGSGGDPSLYQKLKDAEAALAAAQAADDKLKAEQALADAEKLSLTVPSLESYGDGTEYKFGERFNQFFDVMKQSSIFSLPGQMLGSIPGGGQSSFNLSFGRFGQTTFDLASYGASINIIKTLVLIIFSIAGIRIVTLKGGS